MQIDEISVTQMMPLNVAAEDRSREAAEAAQRSAWNGAARKQSGRGGRSEE